MKSERITLLVTPSEKEQINRQAAALGISASEFLRKAASLLDAQDIKTLEDIRSLLPEFNAAVDRIHENLQAALDSSLEQERKMAGLRGAEYRRRLISSLIRNHWEDIEATAGLFGYGATEAASEGGGTTFERMANVARTNLPSTVQDSALDHPPELGKKKA